MGAGGAVRIETAPEEQRTNVDYRWRDDSRQHRARELGRTGSDAESADLVDPDFLNEIHHLQYGRPWALGRYVFEFLVESGCRPDHRVLDFGCGALRAGVHVIPYLNAGNYFGVDPHLRSLQ